MNRKEVTESFASQSKPRGKASNLYYDGKVAYSYGSHFPLAVITGEKKVTVNGDKYSSSTSRHQSQMRHALTQEGYVITEADTDTMKALAAKARA